jgi:hypothetical protein
MRLYRTQLSGHKVVSQPPSAPAVLPFAWRPWEPRAWRRSSSARGSPIATPPAAGAGAPMSITAPSGFSVWPPTAKRFVQTDLRPV